jgi:hypothetical protein
MNKVVRSIQVNKITDQDYSKGQSHESQERLRNYQRLEEMKEA